MNEKQDVIVIGGGAMGLATAWQLAKQGVGVTVLEQFEPLHTKGSSHGGSRIYRATYVQREYLDLMDNALGMWDELEGEAGIRLLSRVGLVSHGFPPRDFEEPMRAAGIPLEVLTADEAHERWPGMRFEGKVLHEHATAGRVNADLTQVALRQQIEAHGGRVIFNAKVRDARVETDHVVVESDAGVFLANRVVVAAGGWANELAPQLLGLDKPLPLDVIEVAPAHFQISYSGDVEAMREENWPSFTHDHAPVDPTTGAPTRWPGIVYGLATSGEGIKLGFNGYGVTTGPNSRTWAPQPGALELHKEYVREWMPGLDADSAQPLSCTYTRTPTDDFIVDRVGRVVIASPCSGHGFKFVPALGEMIAKVTLSSDSELDAVRPELFSLSHALRN